MNQYSNGQSGLEGEVCSSREVKVEGSLERAKGVGLSDKAYKIFSFIPFFVFAVFVMLMIVFIVLLPVAKIDAFGVKEKYGSIVSATGFDEINGLNTVSIAILILSFISLLYAIVIMRNKFSILKYRGFFGKPLYKILEEISVVFVLAYFIFAMMIIGKINAVDEGVGIIKVAAYPILTAILSVASLLTIVISIVLCGIYEKSNPEILENWKEERRKVKTEAKPSKAKKVANYGSKKFFKLLLIPVLILIFTFGLNASNLVERFNAKSFHSGDLKQILLEDSGKFEVGKFSVENAIGKGYLAEGANENEGSVTYYTNNYLQLLKKAERNQKYTLLAFEQGDYRISKLLKQAKNIETEKETIAYGKAEITYDQYGCVQEVVYNNFVIDGFPAMQKKLDKIQIFHIVEGYSDQTHTTHRAEKIVYLATYTDGSFIYRTCKDAVVVLEDGTTSNTYEGSYVGKTFKWQDVFGEYEMVAQANQN